MDLTEIAVAVITTGPAYIAVCWTVFKNKPQQQTPSCTTCAAHAPACAACDGRPASDMDYVVTWALAA
ncbi:hypothetical protein ACQPZG_30790 [Streptomyces sp. CA-294286]|uniref:hypothetical protein n=1 Tax=Streptomyces sp. CA-294286 TaxID=3240070 RepID=UPI003D8E3681